MINTRDVSKDHGIEVVLAGVTFSLGSGQKAALVGSNGVGKSTLLRIIAGVEEPDSGSVEMAPDVCVGYLPQEAEVVGAETVGEYLRQVTGIGEMEKEMAKLEPDLEDPKKLDAYSRVQDTYLKMDGYRFDHRVEVVLEGFGLVGFLARKMSSLSGGQRSKVLLSSILLKGVDVLLLDEPTNNLDLPSLVWLENFITGSDATCLIVSHDRRFLDKTVDRVFEVDWHTRTLNSHPGGYSAFLDFKAGELRRQKEEYIRQQEEISRLEDTAKKKKRWAALGASQGSSDRDKISRNARRDRSAKSAKRAKAIEKQLDQMVRVENPKEREPLVIPLSAKGGLPRHGIKLRDVVVGYASGFRIGPISLDIPFGSRVGILGVNGSGKSTLLKVISGDLAPLSGKVSQDSSLILGNLNQEHDNLPREETPLGFLVESAGASKQEVFHLLSRFGFSREEAGKKISRLSPGGRARLLLALFSARSVNTLVLDEPTNHLDLEAMEALEEILGQYKGTVLLVSHDRYFLENSNLTQTYVVGDGGVRSVSSYEEYAASVVAEAQRMIKRL